MTLTTLIITAVALSAPGLSGPSAMLQTLLIGGVVCTALSMSGSLVTQYKGVGLSTRRSRPIVSLTVTRACRFSGED